MFRDYYDTILCWLPATWSMWYLDDGNNDKADCNDDDANG